jgi:hypothetical protein
MSGLLWFIAGFVSCLVVSGLSVAFLVWRTPPASEPAEDQGLQFSQTRQGLTHPRLWVLWDSSLPSREIWPLSGRAVRTVGPRRQAVSIDGAGSAT